MTMLILSDPIELTLKNCKERIDIFVRDDVGDPLAATTVELTVTDASDNVVFVDRIPDYQLTGTLTVAAAGTVVTGTNTKFQTELDEGDSITFGTETHVVDTISSDTSLVLATAHVLGATGAIATKASRLVNPATGAYHVEWGDPAAAANLPDNTETSTLGQYMFTWKVDAGPGGSEQESVTQVVKVVSACAMGLLPYFRNIIDKSVKKYDTDPDNPCFLGYTDAQLMQYLEEGLTIINAYEPYPCWNKLEDFPTSKFLHILLESALIAGVLSQQLFAIDEDVPNFNDQGNTFVIQHGPQLAAVFNQISLRLDKLIPQMKLKFVNSGSIHIEAGTNFRLSTLLSAAPNGALFRNIAFRG